MTMNAAPPGWEAHKTTWRVDGWIIDPEREDRIPATIAEMIARAMPTFRSNRGVADVRARMRIRHRMLYRHLKTFGHGS
jgi:hypothetical protein